MCAPVFTEGEGLASQVSVGQAEGLKRQSWVMCDNLVSVPKSALTDYVGALGPGKLDELADALRAALGLN